MDRVWHPLTLFFKSPTVSWEVLSSRKQCLHFQVTWEPPCIPACFSPRNEPASVKNTTRVKHMNRSCQSPELLQFKTLPKKQATTSPNNNIIKLHWCFVSDSEILLQNSPNQASLLIETIIHENIGYTPQPPPGLLLNLASGITTIQPSFAVCHGQASGGPGG